VAAKKPAKKVAKAPAKKSSAVGKVAKAVGKVASAVKKAVSTPAKKAPASKAKPAAKPVAPAAPAPAPVASAPLLTRLNAIKEHFPVVWHKVEDADTRTAIYALEIFGKKITEMAHASRRTPADIRADIETRLMAALRASPAWRVLRSMGREFCRLEMA